MRVTSLCGTLLDMGCTESKPDSTTDVDSDSSSEYGTLELRLSEISADGIELLENSTEGSLRRSRSGSGASGDTDATDATDAVAPLRQEHTLAMMESIQADLETPPKEDQGSGC